MRISRASAISLMIWLHAAGVCAAAGTLQGLPYNTELLEKLKKPSAAERREAALDLAKMGADARAAVPELTKTASELDAGVRAASAYALGEIGLAAEPAAMILLRNVTSDKVANVRKESVVALGKIGQKASKTLGGILKLFRVETDEDVRESIAATIVKIGSQSKETYTSMADALSDPSPAIRESAAKILGRIGPPARPALPAVEKAGNDTNPKVADAARLAQLQINGELEDPPEDPDAAQKTAVPEWSAFGAPELLTLLKSPTPSTRRKAVWQIVRRKADLGAQARPTTIALATMMRDDPEFTVRAAAATALGEIGGDPVELSRALNDTEPSVRVAAARALGTLGIKARATARNLFYSRIKDVAAPVRRAAGEALKRMEREADAGVANAAEPQLKRNAQAILQKLTDDIVKSLSETLEKADEDVRTRATMCAAEIGPAAKDIIPQLILLLKDSMVFVRAGAAMALGEMGPDGQKSIPAIEELLKDRDARVRKRATDALARLGKPVAVAAPTPPVAAPTPPPTAEKPPAEGPAAAPVAEKPKPPAGSLAAQVAELLDGEGGITDPSSTVENDHITLILQMAHDRFEEDMAHGDGVRLCLKILVNIEKVESISVHTMAKNGRLLKRYRVTRAKAAPFIEKLDDPFARRRARDWWGEMAERVR